MKFIKMLIMSVFITSCLGITSFAGEWKEDETGWFYENTDGSYLKSGWYWINGKCYYFNSAGYILIDTETSDGSKVDKTGAWIKDGIVQEQEAEIRIGTIASKIPNGYSYHIDEDKRGMILQDGNKGIQIIIVPYNGISDIKQLYGDAGLEEVSDNVVDVSVSDITVGATLVTKDDRDFNDIHWYHYLYNVVSPITGQNTTCEVYTSYVGEEIRLVFFIGGTSREFISNDDFIKNFIK